MGGLEFFYGNAVFRCPCVNLLTLFVEFLAVFIYWNDLGGQF